MRDYSNRDEIWSTEDYIEYYNTTKEYKEREKKKYEIKTWEQDRIVIEPNYSSYTSGEYDIASIQLINDSLFSDSVTISLTKEDLVSIRDSFDELIDTIGKKRDYVK